MKRILLMIVALAVGALAPTAHAGMWISLNDGTTSVAVGDGGAGDINPVVGVITYSGAVGGNWLVNVTTGISKPVIGGPGNAQLDLNSVNVSSTGPGTMTLRVTDTDFTLPGGGGQMISQIGGTTGGTVQLLQTLDPDNSEFAATNPGNDTAILSPLLGPGAFSSNQVASVGSLAGPFSLTEMVVVTHTGAGQITSFDAFSEVVPVPGAVLLGVLGLGVAGLKLRKFA